VGLTEDIISRVDTDFNGALKLHNEQMAKIEEWREIYRAEPTGDTKRRKARMVTPDVKKMVESALPSLVEPFLNESIVNAKGKDAVSQRKSKKASTALNYQWNYSQDTLTFIESIAKTLMIDGTAFIKSAWGGSAPYAKVVDVDAVIVDPSAQSLSESVFLIEREKVSISGILSNPEWYGEHTLESLNALQGTTTTDYDKTDVGDSSFNFDDRMRELVDIKTYYGWLPAEDGSLEKSIVIWSGSTLINTMKSPYPDGWIHPFSATQYIRVVGSIYGDSIASIIDVNQKIRTGLERSILDTLNKSTNGQKGFPNGALDPKNRRLMNEGKDFDFNSDFGDIWEGRYNDVPPHVYSFMEMVKGDSEELTGITRLNAGLDPRALNSGVSATASSLVNSAAQRRLLLITRHIASLLEDMFRKWLDMNALLLEPDSIPYEDGSVMDMDVDGNFDIVLNIATSGQKEMRMRSLDSALRLVASNPSIPQSVTMGLTASLFESMDLYVEAEKLKDIAQKMVLEENTAQREGDSAGILDNAKVMAEINKDNAKAALDEAKAIQTHIASETAMYQ